MADQLTQAKEIINRHMNIKELKLQAEVNRKRLIEVIYNAKAGHTGGDLSCLNMMTALYFGYMNLDPKDLKNPNRDRFILSKGHCVESLFVVLEAMGILSKEVLDTLGKYDSPLAGHPTINVPGIEVNSGALGHGLSIGVGISIAAKMDKKSYKTFVMMGDGEQGEGSIYEAAMAGSHYKLDNLVAIIDRNRLQISGCTEDVMAIDSVSERWSAFGWDVIEVNGDCMKDIVEKLNGIDFNNGKPHLLISNTTKGLGVSYMENVAKWHHGVPTEEQYKQALEDIDLRIKKAQEE